MFARTASGDLAIPLKVVTDVGTVTAQKLTDCFNLWQGAWFQDTTIGIPFLQKILGRKTRAATLARTRSILRQAALEVPAVISVTDLPVSISVNRLLSYSLRAKINTGQVLVGGSGVPFIVTGSAA